MYSGSRRTPRDLQAMPAVYDAPLKGQSASDLGGHSGRKTLENPGGPVHKPIAAGSSKRPRQDSYGRVGSECPTRAKQRCKGEAWT